MEDFFNLLSGSARLNKVKRKKPNNVAAQYQSQDVDHTEAELTNPEQDSNDPLALKSRDQTGKRDTSKEKLEQIHREQISAFRRSMSIKISNKYAADTADPISSFHELINKGPDWWNNDNNNYTVLMRTIIKNVEAGRWKEPTPIQMQAIPTLLERRDLIGAAPTGSGKSGSFIIPSLIICSAPNHIFYNDKSGENLNEKTSITTKTNVNKKGHQNREGEIRSLLLAPSLELASQLHREIERLGTGKPGGLSALLLNKNNSTNILAGTAGGKKGVDILVSTPLRLVDAISKGLKLNGVRMVVLDEADRLLDSSDGKVKPQGADDNKKNKGNDSNKNTEQEITTGASSGSAQSQSFLSQMDVILSEIPSTATRALFSATITPMVRTLSDSILRNPVDVTIASSGLQGGANPDIEQELLFVGKEEGKLLAIRQLCQKGQLRPPAIIFLESQERAQALYGELLYDGIHVDVIHAGRSNAAREAAVAKFRKGESWVLICTDLVARGVDFRAVNMVINYDIPASGVTYVHRIGRTGRAGRKGKAITLFTEADFANLRTIANVMKQSGCNVQDWMLNLPQDKMARKKATNRRQEIDTTPSYDKKKRNNIQQAIAHNKKKRMET